MSGEGASLPFPALLERLTTDEDLAAAAVREAALELVAAAIVAERADAAAHVRRKMVHIQATMGEGRIVTRGGVERVETEQAEHLCRVLGELANDLDNGFHVGGGA